MRLVPRLGRRLVQRGSLSGTYGFLHGTTDSNGTPDSGAVSQITFDSTTGTFTGETTASHDGVIISEPLSGTYAVASNCTGTGNPTGGSPFSFVVTSTGFLAAHLLGEGFAVKQGSRPAPMPELRVVLGLRQPASSSKGWIEERGSKFLKSWDPQYEPLLETHDPNQDPQKGGMVIARYGSGVYMYTAYAFYRQLPLGVPGAYRIFANLLSLSKNPLLNAKAEK